MRSTAQKSWGRMGRADCLRLHASRHRVTPSGTVCRLVSVSLCSFRHDLRKVRTNVIDQIAGLAALVDMLDAVAVLWALASGDVLLGLVAGVIFIMRRHFEIVTEASENAVVLHGSPDRKSVV